MSKKIEKSIAFLKGELSKLENQIKEKNFDSSSEIELSNSSKSIALLHELPSNREVRTRLQIRFAEKIQDSLGQIVAQETGKRRSQRKNQEAAIDVFDVDVDDINVNVNTSTSIQGDGTVITCGETKVITYQSNGDASRTFWFNLEAAEIDGQKDAIKTEAEEKAKENAKNKATAEARNAVCSGGSCPSGTCPSIPAAIIHDPTVVSSDASYSDSSGWAYSAGSSVSGEATAHCKVTYKCPCI